MRSGDFWGSAAEIRSELNQVVRKREDDVDAVVEEKSLLDQAKTEVENTGSELATEPFGATMSSRALDATNNAREDLRNKLHSEAIYPSLEAIDGAKNALGKL